MSAATKDTVWRQWSLLRLMPRAPTWTTASELRKALARQGIEVSRRTIERDLQVLSGRFPLLADESSKPFGWCWARDANFQFTPRLSASQGVALLLAKAHLRTLLPSTVLAELIPLFDLADQELAHGDWSDWHRRTAVVPTSLSLLPPSIAPGVLNDVHEALLSRRKLVASYRSKGATASRETTIHPLGLIVRGPVQYLVCTLFDYGDIRQLALHRLSATQVSSERCEIPDGFDFPEYVRPAMKYESEGPVRLVARFAPDAADHLRETALSKDQRMVELADTGRIEVSATVELDQTLRWWLKAFGSRVEVREPAELRDEFAADLRASLAQYDAA